MIGSHTKDGRLANGAQVGNSRTERDSFELIKPGSGKGRLMYVRDILDLLRNEKSAWWVRNCFAPEHRFKVGRSPAWWESDAHAWLENRRSQ